MRRIGRGAAARSAVVAGALLLSGWGGCSGCQSWNLDYAKRHVREDRGPVLVGQRVDGLAFLPGGAEVAYFAKDWSSGEVVVWAVRVDDESRRELGRYPDLRLPVQLLPASDGTALYLEIPAQEATSADELRDVYRGAAIPLERNPWQWTVAKLSPDGSRFLYWAEGAEGAEPQLLVQPTEGGAATQLACRYGPVDFSPDGSEVVCFDSGQAGEPLVRKRLSDGSSTKLNQPEGSVAWTGASWTTSGIRLAGIGGGEYEKLFWYDEASDRVHALYHAPSHTEYHEMLFSPDGRGLGFVEVQTLQEPGDLLGILHEELRFRLGDLATGKVHTVASGEPGGGQFAFSPDGTTLVYQFADGLHIRPTGL